ncbi:MAG: DUF6240 domain-containing protein [Lachnospiraceae bacterium]|nr:DUF6240 domain-containing protein [Lachnospiraceae bacterium]
MKISFNHDINSNVKSENVNINRESVKSRNKDSAVRVDIGVPVNFAHQEIGLDAGDKKGMGKTLTDLRNEAGSIDNDVNRNYRVVLSNTMSGEDYAKACEEGFDLYKTDPEETVTILDRIKAEVAKSGNVIVGYNDSLSSEKLANALGSETLARGIENSYEGADIPFTDENITEISEAVRLAKSLENPTDEEKAYLIGNDLETSLWGLYLSENSANINAGYGEKKGIDLSLPSNSKMLDQIRKVVNEAGFEGEGEKVAIENAGWLLNKELPINEDTLKKLEDINSIKFPLTDETIINTVTTAVLQGQKPIDAPIVSDKESKQSVISKAVALETYYNSDEAAEKIGQRRYLEEVRLSMTAEVNIKLLSSDYYIDTKPIEEFVEALKSAEREVAVKYFPQNDGNLEKSVEDYRLLNETENAVDDIKAAPVAVLGMFTQRTLQSVDISEFRSEGQRLTLDYAKAGESYEALMTAPRADLGDNIKKAFANVSGLVKELGIEETEDNLRAVRILGYNSMEINQDNISKVSAADNVVRNIIEKMTPKSVIGMIRDGINPLETSFSELSTYLDTQQTGGYEMSAKSYSEFLYGLEMQDDITPEERESYIGIYRLIHQIEKNDDAAVGTVLNAQESLGFNNLLSAARTRRIKGIDIRLDENFGRTSDLIKTAATITEQISSAFSAQRMANEAEELRSASKVDPEAANILRNSDASVNAENLIAINNLLSSDSNLYEELSKYEKGAKKVKDTAASIFEKMSQGNFDEDYESAVSELEESAEELTTDAKGYIDVKALQSAHRQMGLSVSIAHTNDALTDRDYIIPMEMGDDILKVRLSFRSSGDDANVRITTKIGEEDIEAFFELSGENLEGYIVQNDKNSLKNLQITADIFDESLKTDALLENISIGETPVISKESGNKKSAFKDKNLSKGKDAGAVNSDGSERRILLQVTKLFLQSVERSHHEN